MRSSKPDPKRLPEMPYVHVWMAVWSEGTCDMWQPRLTDWGSGRPALMGSHNVWCAPLKRLIGWRQIGAPDRRADVGVEIPPREYPFWLVLGILKTAPLVRCCFPGSPCSTMGCK